MYKRQIATVPPNTTSYLDQGFYCPDEYSYRITATSLCGNAYICLLYTSDAADERSSVDLGGRRIIKKKNKTTHIINTSTNKEHNARSCAFEVHVQTALYSHKTVYKTYNTWNTY